MGNNINPVILCILDGWGYNPSKKYNAIKLANTPTWDNLIKNNPHTFIRTDGEYVGLPKGQMGNSEVGHTNIGTGRIIYQDLPKITTAFNTKQVDNSPQIQQIIEKAKINNSTIHIMGLCSDGGIHSHIDHILGSIKILSESGAKITLHLFTDGRDSPPQMASQYIQQVHKFIEENNFNNVSIATISGRYYAMDRDHRWERTELAYKAIVLGEANNFLSAETAIEEGYKILANENSLVSDEFIKPSKINNYNGMQDNDILFMINFRADRARQLLTALLEPNFNGFERKKIIKFSYALGMVNYSKELDKLMHTVFPNIDLKNTLGEVISKHNLQQMHAAETEKYPHVTFFFNGGRENPFPGEDRILIPSPKVATYDLQPEMSAYLLKDKLLESINSKKYALIVVNFANSDMVGHTGVLEAAIKAVEAVDSCLTSLHQAALHNNYTLIVTADHGNSETMWDETNNVPHTQHTTNPVRFIVCNAPKNIGKIQLNEGKLADIAPTILEIMKIKVPSDMTGSSLLNAKCTE